MAIHHTRHELSPDYQTLHNDRMLLWALLTIAAIATSGYFALTYYYGDGTAAGTEAIVSNT
jgi:hypothetical protein